MNENSPRISILSPFVLSQSKDSERVFRQAFEAVYFKNVSRKSLTISP
jgi:hypothetical protein